MKSDGILLPRSVGRNCGPLPQRPTTHPWRRPLLCVSPDRRMAEGPKGPPSRSLRNVSPPDTTSFSEIPSAVAAEKGKKAPAGSSVNEGETCSIRRGAKSCSVQRTNAFGKTDERPNDLPCIARRPPSLSSPSRHTAACPRFIHPSNFDRHTPGIADQE